MGTYYIPNNKLKGEGRILYIFTGKSLIATGIGAAIGSIPYLIIKSFGHPYIGFLVMVLFAIIAYLFVTIKVPTMGTTRLTKNVGGESLDQIFREYLIFKKNRKVYSYAIPRKRPDYIEKSDSKRVWDVLQERSNNTKEDNR